MAQSIDFSRALHAGSQAALSAAAVLQAYAHNRSDLVIDTKAKNDLVSQADREAELAIITLLQDQTPELSIIAEESGSSSFKGPATWYIDPLDGTTNFLHGIPQYAVSLGLIAHAGTCIDSQTIFTQDTPIVSIVYDPCREEMFTAVYGAGAWLNGHPIKCSQCPQISEAVLATGMPFRDFSFAEQYMPTLHHAIYHSRGVRRLGAAALDLAWVAAGRYDGYWEMGLAPWDVAAGTLLVREAGGKAEDMYGQDSWPKTGYVIAANAKLFDQLKSMIDPHLNSNVKV